MCPAPTGHTRKDALADAHDMPGADPHNALRVLGSFAQRKRQDPAALRIISHVVRSGVRSHAARGHAVAPSRRRTHHLVPLVLCQDPRWRAPPHWAPDSITNQADP
ncbi:hypothetical protein CBM2587_B100043 [Cupriavidus taiwanensis]|uniref:Uncharacterized protein n=1 Tax=Cupriavidus taiwanensis TaxID=164546 RepID=A0A975X6P5_9BURK|nr:hypothetical protein CBM2587_B100043 [Cupriavidus taiwanensis]